MAEKDSKQFRLEKWIIIGVLVLLPNSGYLVAFADASLFYLGNVFLHVGLGLLLFIPILLYGRRFLRQHARLGKELGLYAGHLGYWLLLAGLALGLFLTLNGVKQKNTLLLYAHIVLSLLGIVFFIVSIRRVGHQISISNPINTAGRYLLVFISLGVCIPVIALVYRLLFVRYDDRIHNPHAAPKSMAEEALNGEQSPFYPSSIATVTGDTISADFMLAPETCGAAGCHPDIYEQWQSSTHRVSDFKNLWYRSSANVAEQNLGANGAKWCAGCHMPAALLSGVSHLPRAQQTQAAASHAGISCTVCHAIVDVRGTMGQAGFIIEKPALYDMLASKNETIKKLYAWFVHLDPAPHRVAFRQPFHRNENGAFCSSCHKAHTDTPLNGARWLQVMNDYDAWQDGNFGQADHDFSYIEKRKNCVACHMPLVDTHDGQEQVRDHRFLGANTLLPTLHKDEAQLQSTLAFLREQRLALDLFAVSLASEAKRDSTSFVYQKNKTAQTATIIETRAESLPKQALDVDSLLVLEKGGVPALDRGQSFRLDVVVRSQNIGHFFPAGAADMAQAWLEVKVEDNLGKTIFWSGAMSGEEVDPSAHFYGVEMIDSTGQRVTHERSWEARAASFVNLLPPNSAELVRYRITLPEDCGDRIQLTAKLHYRKYRPAHLQWLAAPGLDASLREIHIPIVEMARAETSFALGASQPRASANDTTGNFNAAQRWQNYGIGALRQSELVAAEHAFRQAQQLAPDDIYHAINLGAVLLRTKRESEAKKLFEAAVEKDERSARAEYYLGMAFKAEGDYRKALSHVKRASELANRDREFRLEIGRIYHLLGDYERALRSFKRALRIDPEDPVVYQEMMTSYNAKGDPKSAARVEKLYLRFSKDEGMKELERKFASPNCNAVPHLYHEHGSSSVANATATNGHSQ